MYKLIVQCKIKVCGLRWSKVFNATFNNISVISWRWMKQEDSGKTTDLSQVTDKLYHMQKWKKNEIADIILL
jgi:hypothetical protein